MNHLRIEKFVDIDLKLLHLSIKVIVYSDKTVSQHHKSLHNTTIAMDVDPQRIHKKRKAGAKFNKKKRRKLDEDESAVDTDAKKRNPKAFSFQV